MLMRLIQMFLLLFLSLFLLLLCSPTSAAPDSASIELESSESGAIALKAMKKILPSQDALEQVGVTFLDALIKAGQIEMAKGAFKTQLNVLKKVQPDQYKKYKGIPISRLAADAVLDQAQQQAGQPQTGNKLIDMLNSNGIPIASSLKGIQQAIKTQKEIENNDPTEQIAKAVFEKFQKQILPGLVANLIAGKNPFQMAQRPEMMQMQKQQQRAFKMQHETALKQIQERQLKTIGKVQNDQFDITPFLANMKKQPDARDGASESEDEEGEEYEEEEGSAETAPGTPPPPQKEKQPEYEDESGETAAPPSTHGLQTPTNDEEIEYEDESEEKTAKNEVRKIRKRRQLDSKFFQFYARNPQIQVGGGGHAQITRKKRQTRLLDLDSEGLPYAEGVENASQGGQEMVEQTEMKIGQKAAMLLGVYEQFPDLVDNDDTNHSNEDVKEIRRHKIPLELAQKILQSERLRPLLTNDEISYQLSDPEGYLQPKKIVEDPDPQPGFVTPRPIPQRPRKMLTLLIGKDSDLAGASDDDEPNIDPDSEFLKSVENEKKVDTDSDEYYDEDGDENSPTSKKQPPEPFRRHPSNDDSESVFKAPNIDSRMTRTLLNLKNNPGVVTVLDDQQIVEKMLRPTVLTASQRMGVGMPEKRTEVRPRLAGVATLDGKTTPPNAMDMKVKQVIEERDVPPLFWIPRGRHTRLRWTGATEKEIPGLGTRMVLPSLDPTMPAINSVVSTQGKARDEYDSTFKIPNYWNPGDVFGIDAKTTQERLVGGDGAVDFPAMQAGMTFG